MTFLTTTKDSLKQTWKYSVLMWLVVWTVGYISFLLIPFRHEYQGFPWLREARLDFLHTVSNLWDTVFFARIADHGYYTIQDHTGNLNYLFAFFPAVPFALASLNIFIGSVFSPVLYSLVCILLLGMVAKQTYHQILGDSQSWKWFYIIPFSIFLFVPYTESMFVIILLLVLGILFKKEYKPITTNVLLLVLGLLCTLTRSVALLLGVSISTIGVVYWLKNKQIQDKQFLVKSIFFGTGSILGVGVVALLNQIGSGSWNTFLLVQSYWGRSISGGRFWDPIVRAILETFSGNISFSLVTLVGFFGIYLIIFFIKPIYNQFTKLYWISLVFSILITYTTVSQNTLQSINRYLFATPVILILLPYVLEKYVPSKFKAYAYIASFCFLLLTAGLFFRHYWVG